MENAAMGMSWMEILKTSIVMPVLLVLSVSILAQALERVWMFWLLETMPHFLWRKVQRLIQSGETEDAAQLCQGKSGTVAEALTAIFQRASGGAEEMMEAYQIHRQKFQLRLARRLGLFGTVSFIAPLIGLL